MVRFLFYLMATIICTTSEYCKSPFCSQNFNRSTNYSISLDNYAFNLTHFTFFLFNGIDSNNCTIIISSPKEIGIRIKTEQNNYSILFENESLKYDLSSEDCVINQTILQNFDILKLTFYSDQYIQIDANDIQLKIYVEQFTIDFFKSNVNIATFNKNHNFLFEYPDFSDDYEDITSASGVDISLTNENIYFFSGLGDKSQSINIDDKIYRLYNTDLYPNHSSVPFIIAHSPKQISVGFFWANPSETFIRCANNSIRFLSETGFVDLYIFFGSADKIQSQYALLTGKPFFAPIFSLGYHQCRNFYRTQKEVNAVILNMTKANISFDSIWLGINHLAFHASFGYNETTFPEPKKLIGGILAEDRYLIRLSSSFLPTNANYIQYKEAKLNGYLVNRSDGENIFVSYGIAGRSVFPDFLNKKTRQWWSIQYRYNVDISNTNVFYWNDKNEVSFPKDVVHYKGFENRDIHNIYGLLISAATFQGLIDRNLQNTEKAYLRPYLVSLNIFSGSQKYAWSWTGDTNSTWDDLKKSLSQVVSNGISGIPFTGSDVGGYHGSPSDELIIRWFQLATWCYPFFRQQSSSTSKKREPFFYKGDTFIAISNAIAERYKHLLIWYNAARVSNLKGIPIVKPLWSFLKTTKDFPQAHTITDQVIVADTFMLAPIIEKNQTIKFIVKPPGRWYCYPGGYEIHESTNFLVTIMDTPIFLSGGKIILVYKEIGSTTIETLQKENLEMFIALNENDEAFGEVYIDDGVSYNYLNGSFINIMMYLKKGILMIRSYGNFGISFLNDNENFIKRLKISRIHIFGLKKQPKKNPKYEATFNGDKYILNIDKNPILLHEKTNIRIIDPGLNNMTIATIVISVILGLAIIVISIIVPIVLLRREKVKDETQSEENTTDIKNPILNTESL